MSRNFFEEFAKNDFFEKKASENENIKNTLGSITPSVLEKVAEEIGAISDEEDMTLEQKLASEEEKEEAKEEEKEAEPEEKEEAKEEEKEAESEEKEEAKKDMGRMLDYIDQLNELDTTGVEPMSHVFPVQNVFREDVVTNGDGSAATLSNAPGQKDGGFKVPKTIGE